MLAVNRSLRPLAKTACRRSGSCEFSDPSSVVPYETPQRHQRLEVRCSERQPTSVFPKILRARNGWWRVPPRSLMAPLIRLQRGPWIRFGFCRRVRSYLAQPSTQTSNYPSYIHARSKLRCPPVASQVAVGCCALPPVAHQRDIRTPQQTSCLHKKWRRRG